MVVETIVKKGIYRDSVKLMRISNTINELPGVFQAVVVMGTQLNKQLLMDVDLITDEGKMADANDLLIGINAQNEKILHESTIKEIKVVGNPKE